MKKFINILLILISFGLVFTACEDRTDLTPPSAPNPKSGNADLTRFVSIGNSLTAGYQSGALYQSAQIYSFVNLIAQQVGTSFEQPLVSDPGTGGRMEIQSLDFATGQVSITFNSGTGTPLNLNYPAPYNNLGIPGALLFDVLNATDSTNCASALFANSPNPLFNLILRGIGTQFQQAKLLHPTFVTLWIGNNDVLGFAASGGVAPAAPTDAATFQGLYSLLADSIASLGANVVVANIPNVTSIPYFTTVGPVVAQEVPWPLLQVLGLPGLCYQKHGEVVGSGFADSSALMTGAVLITLPASNYAAYIGDTTGTFDNLYYKNGIPAGIDTHKPLGFHPQNPVPDGLVLDPDEITTALNATTAFNTAIGNLAAQYNFGLVNINDFYDNIRAADFSGGVTYNGITFTTRYILGGLFSLDGVHPSSRGQAILANEFIKVINSKFNAGIPLINVSTIPASLLLAKINLNRKDLIPYYQPGSFNHLFF